MDTFEQYTLAGGHKAVIPKASRICCHPHSRQCDCSASASTCGDRDVNADALIVMLELCKEICQRDCQTQVQEANLLSSRCSTPVCPRHAPAWQAACTSQTHPGCRASTQMLPHPLGAPTPSAFAGSFPKHKPQGFQVRADRGDALAACHLGFRPALWEPDCWQPGFAAL